MKCSADLNLIVKVEIFQINHFIADEQLGVKVCKLFFNCLNHVLLFGLLVNDFTKKIQSLSKNCVRVNFVKYHTVCHAYFNVNLTEFL